MATTERLPASCSLPAAPRDARPRPAETMAEAYGVKRVARNALLERLNAELDEFA